MIILNLIIIMVGLESFQMVKNIISEDFLRPSSFGIITISTGNWSITIILHYMQSVTIPWDPIQLVTEFD